MTLASSLRSAPRWLFALPLVAAAAGCAGSEAAGGDGGGGGVITGTGTGAATGSGSGSGTGAGAGAGAGAGSGTGAGSSSGSGGSGGVVYPDPDWPMGTPAEVGIDASKLDEASMVAEGYDSYCLLVIRHGKLVYEKYYQGTDETTANKSWSLAKSYTSTLVGIALGRGEIHSLDDSVSTYVPEWTDADHAPITVRDLLRMTSGLKWSAWQDYVEFATFTSDQTAYALNLDVTDPPGSKWVYHNGAIQVFEALMRNATGQTLEAYAQQHLWSKIGTSATWAHDGAGQDTAYANVLASCRDHARLGYLYLHHGDWKGNQVVPTSYVTEALTPSQPINRAYGFLFWLNGGTPAEDAMNEAWPGMMVPFAPVDLFAARGFGNQFIDVIPSLDMMVIRFGTDPVTNFDPAAMAEDSKFTKHDDILKPILEGVQN